MIHLSLNIYSHVKNGRKVIFYSHIYYDYYSQVISKIRCFNILCIKSYGGGRKKGTYVTISEGQSPAILTILETMSEKRVCIFTFQGLTL